MDSPELAHDNLMIVVLGEFDPMQIIPRWLRDEDLIGPEDFDSHQIEVISPGVTAVTFGSIQLQVKTDSMQIIAALGINRHVHFGLTGEERHAIGDALAPKSLWQGVTDLPGTQTLTITGVRNDGFGGTVNITVQPSNQINPGVFVAINAHFNLVPTPIPATRDANADPEVGNPVRSAEKVPIAVKILTGQFSASRKRTQAIIDRIYSLRTGRHLEGTSHL